MRRGVGGCVLLLMGLVVHCGGSTSEGGPASTQGAEDSGTSPGQCAPKACTDTEQCGTYDDGCGGTVRCEAKCSCNDSNFETVCPQRPCEVVAGCSAGQCTYVPITCGNSLCKPITACAGDECGNVATAAGQTDRLYSCNGKICADAKQYCDPVATVVDGKATFKNQCMTGRVPSCGSCGLGTASCDATKDRFACVDIPVPTASGGGTIECDDSVAGSTFIYVDAQYTGSSPSDGSRKRPFTTYAAAVAAAQARNSRGVVIGGSPTFTETLVVQNGISVYGGFDGFDATVPFGANPTHRPKWSAPTTGLTDNRLVGARAEGITKATALYHVAITTPDLASNANGVGASNIGLLATGSTALTIVDSEITAGAAGSGVAGADGVTRTDVQRNGKNASGRVPGGSGTACAIGCTVTTLPEGQDSNVCGYGGKARWGYNAQNKSYQEAVSGNPGTKTGSGGSGGLNAFPNGCSLNRNPTVGEPGTDGSDGPGGSNGGAGIVRGLDGTGKIDQLPSMDGTAGTNGTSGAGGGGGGGALDDCMNEAKVGGNGGGGGGGGCGGDFGRGGGNGGLSIGLAVIASNGFALRGTKVTSSSGGSGGNGGKGQVGGTGGAGESAALCPSGYNDSYPGKCGGKGGKGGKGGNGGHGGGGAGGNSYALYCNGTTTLVRENVTLTPGPAGLGGTSSGTAGSAGQSAQEQGCE